ncbi:MAG TPA: hypothetical protein VFQ45_00365, partial [Longimicrobium sp.]|nr:hypothetical protein [Longimicrobium sp.]
QGEGKLRALNPLLGDTLVLERTSGDARGWIAINKVWAEPRTVPLAELVGHAKGHRLHRVCRDTSPEKGEAVPDTLELDRAEVAYVLPVEDRRRG